MDLHLIKQLFGVEIKERLKCFMEGGGFAPNGLKRHYIWGHVILLANVNKTLLIWKLRNVII